MAATTPPAQTSGKLNDEDVSEPPQKRSKLPQAQVDYDTLDYKSMVAQPSAALGSAPKLVPLSQRTHESDFDATTVKNLLVGKYKRTWKGQVLMKDAVSLEIYAVLMDKLQPGTIFDLGTCGGGSALWFAGQAKALDLKGTSVVTCDIEDMRSPQCKEHMEKAGNIHFLLADLNDGKGMFAKANEQGIQLRKPWLIAEDCHVDAEIILTCFGPQLSSGDYIIFEDTHPLHADDAWINGETTEYVYGKFSGEKLKLVEAAMSKREDHFAIDASIQDMHGYNGATFINSVFIRR